MFGAACEPNTEPRFVLSRALSACFTRAHDATAALGVAAKRLAPSQSLFVVQNWRCGPKPRRKAATVVQCPTDLQRLHCSMRERRARVLELQCHPRRACRAYDAPLADLDKGCPFTLTVVSSNHAADNRSLDLAMRPPPHSLLWYRSSCIHRAHAAWVPVAPRAHRVETEPVPAPSTLLAQWWRRLGLTTAAATRSLSKRTPL